MDCLLVFFSRTFWLGINKIGPSHSTWGVWERVLLSSSGCSRGKLRTGRSFPGTCICFSPQQYPTYFPYFYGLASLLFSQEFTPFYLERVGPFSLCIQVLTLKVFSSLSLNNFDDRLIKFTSVISFTYCGFPPLVFFVDIIFSSVLLNPSFCFPSHIPWFPPFIFHAVHPYVESMDFTCLKILFSSSDLFWFLPVLTIFLCFLHSSICESSRVCFKIWL